MRTPAPPGAVRPFRVDVADEVLTDLGERLARTRWPDEVEGAGWDYGTDLAYLRELVEYWRTGFDWRERERALNRLPQFVAPVLGLDVHFVHLRGVGPDPFPLVVTHGWPSSFAEMHRIVGPLADPGCHGADPADAFDVVVPSLPGFGFSARPARRGPTRVDRLWRKLMTDVLGYPRFGAHGGDVGARVTSALGRFHGDVVAGIHLGSVDLEWPDPVPPAAELSAAERDYLERVRRWEREEGAYGEIQATRPQTLAYGLNDSPAGLAAWIVEKFRAWSDCGGDVESRFSKDELLTNITLYWVTGTIGSSMRRYFEARHDPAPNPLAPGERIETPTGVAMFPGEKDLLVPREWAERCYDLRRWTEMPRGGHFPALEEPGLLVEDIRGFFREVRSG
jgi:pimeloyl-ACP methyl ester carboxylesterase